MQERPSWFVAPSVQLVPHGRGMLLVSLERTPLSSPSPPVSCCSVVDDKGFLEHEVSRMYDITIKYGVEDDRVGSRTSARSPLMGAVASAQTSCSSASKHMLESFMRIGSSFHI